VATWHCDGRHVFFLSAEAVSSTGLFYLYCLYCPSAGRQATASCQLRLVQDAVHGQATPVPEQCWPRLAASPLTVGTTTAASRPFALRCATLAGRGKSGDGRGPARSVECLYSIALRFPNPVPRVVAGRQLRVRDTSPFCGAPRPAARHRRLRRHKVVADLSGSTERPGWRHSTKRRPYLTAPSHDGSLGLLA